MRIQVVEGSILWMLKKAYKGNPKILDEKLDAIREFFEYRSIRYLKHELNRTVSSSPKRSSPYSINGKEADTKKQNSKKRDFYKWVSILNNMFGVPLEYLVSDDTKPAIEQIQKSRTETSKIKVLSLKGFDKKSDDYRSKRKSDYIKAQIDFLNDIKTDLFVYDYLERQNPNIVQYLEAHDQLFVTIEEELAKRPFAYRRYLALPLRIRGKDPLNLLEKELKKLIIKFSSVDLFQHICRCLKNFPEFNRTNKHPGFYMISNPTRTSHYAVINNGEACLSEYCRFNEKLACKPDILYIENLSQNSPYEKIASHYNEELGNLRKDAVKFTLTDVSELLDTLLEEINLKLSPEDLVDMSDDLIKLYLARQEILEEKHVFFHRLFKKV